MAVAIHHSTVSTIAASRWVSTSKSRSGETMRANLNQADCLWAQQHHPADGIHRVAELKG